MNNGNGTNIGDLGAAPDFAQRMLGSLGLGSGGARNAQSVSAANNASISVSPTFVQSGGSGSPSVAPYVGGSTGTPSSSASASSAGTDPTRAYSPTSLYRPTTGYAADPLNQYAGQGGEDMTLPILLGAAALLFVLMNE